jgi:hypothetical protein
MRGERSRALLFWLSTLIGFEAYSVFGDSPLGLTLAYRVINFLCVPLIIFSAFGFQGLYEACSRLLRAAAVAALMAAVALNVYSVYASISLQERYLGYFWLYRQPEYYAAAWIKDSDGSLTVAGDVKALYLLKCYFNLSVDVFQGLKYLAGNGRKPQILFTYSQMLRNGYVMYGGCSVDLPENWINKASSLNQVYSNSLVNVYVG